MTMNVNKFSKAAGAHRGSANDTFPAIFPGLSQTVAIAAVANPSTAFQDGTTIVRIFATRDCFVLFGPNPTATTADLFLPANFVEYFGVLPGEKLSVLRVSANGTLYITEGEV